MIEDVARELNSIYNRPVDYTPARAYCEPTVIIGGYSIAPPLPPLQGVKNVVPFVKWYLKWRLRDNIRYHYIKEEKGGEDIFTIKEG